MKAGNKRTNTSIVNKLYKYTNTHNKYWWFIQKLFKRKSVQL